MWAYSKFYPGLLDLTVTLFTCNPGCPSGSYMTPMEVKVVATGRVSDQDPYPDPDPDPHGSALI